MEWANAFAGDFRDAESVGGVFSSGAKCDTVSLSRPDFLMEPYGFPVYPVILTVWGCPAGLFSCFCASGYVFHMILRPVPDSKMREDVVK